MGGGEGGGSPVPGGAHAPPPQRNLPAEAFNPSRRRDPTRIAMAIAAGDCPTGKAIPPLIPEGTGPQKFCDLVPPLRHPLEEPPPLPRRLLEALENMHRKGDRIRGWREKRMALIRSKARELRPAQRAWAETLHPNVRRVIGHIHLPLLEWLLQRIHYEDVDYVRTLTRGRNVVGQIGRSHVFPEFENPATTSVEDWMRAAPQRNMRMIESVRPSGDDALDRASWEKTQK